VSPRWCRKPLPIPQFESRFHGLRHGLRRVNQPGIIAAAKGVITVGVFTSVSHQFGAPVLRRRSVLRRACASSGSCHRLYIVSHRDRTGIVARYRRFPHTLRKISVYCHVTV
jgi:hypothetical protein